MTRNRRADWRRVRGKVSYTIHEAAQTLCVHPNSVRHWAKTGSLPMLRESRPHLIIGADLIAFLRSRRQQRKSKCPPGHLYCLRCRCPREPVPGLLEFRWRSATRGSLVALCSECESILQRFVTRSRATELAGEFELQSGASHESLVDAALPSLNCHPINPDTA
jgi:hypothetical protein